MIPFFVLMIILYLLIAVLIATVVEGEGIGFSFLITIGLLWPLVVSLVFIYGCLYEAGIVKYSDEEVDKKQPNKDIDFIETLKDI